ncbi:hypothetical protein EJ08DRAFT_595957, partial [Tothia fuscella]
VNGQDQGRGDAVPGYVRKIFDNNPVKDVKSADMTCNRNKGVNTKTISVKGGDKVTITWAHNNKGDEVIADSHKGPVQVYMAPGTTGKGNVWVKIASKGFENGKWATDELRQNKGQHSFTIPPLSPGDYLVRPEIVALHEGSKQGGAQLYMACVQVKVTGSGTKTLPAGLSFPGAYSATDPGIMFNVYDKPMKKYTPPGGPVKTI